MLFWNIFVFFLLPLLVLFLTRKLSVRGMILWTAGVQVVALLLRMVVYPVRLSLSWGMSLLESLSYSNLSAWYSGSGVQLSYLAVNTSEITAIVIACAAGVRKKRRIV